MRYAGRGWGSRSRGVCVGDREIDRGSLTVKDELNLLADRSSLFIPMAERGGCYGCLTLCNAIIFCVVHTRGPVDPRPWPARGRGIGTGLGKPY